MQSFVSKGLWSAYLFPVENGCIQCLFGCVYCLAESGAAVKRMSWGSLSELEPVVLISPALVLILCCLC